MAKTPGQLEERNDGQIIAEFQHGASTEKITLSTLQLLELEILAPYALHRAFDPDAVSVVGCAARIVSCISQGSNVMAEQDSIEKMKSAHPVDTELFGDMGAVAAHLCDDLSHSFVGKQFELMDNGEFQALKDASQLNRIYWRELLFRVYWAAALNIMRHQRWQAACIRAFTAPANFLAFAASLRALLEASQDACYSLGPVITTLAEHRAEIESALDDRLTNIFAVSEIEDRLIHFVYARKIGKQQREMTPQSHVALEPKDYRSAMGLPEDERESFRELYDHLCGICHPTAFSLVFFWESEGRRVQLKVGRDESYIRALCHKYEETISLALSLSVTQSALCLKALNWFSLPEVKCKAIEPWNFDNIPAWKKAQASASAGTVQ